MTTIPLDNKLVESLQKGDADAFDTLFHLYAKKLYAFGLKYLRSKEDAEELVQGVFLKIWERRKTLKREASFQAFLFTIAYNDICNLFRKRATERKYKDQLAADLSISGTNSADQTEYKLVLEQVYKIVNQLPEKQRIVFLKSRREGLSSKEIATQLNLSPGTVDNYLSAALKFLRNKLDYQNLPLVLFVTLWYF